MPLILPVAKSTLVDFQVFFWIWIQIHPGKDFLRQIVKKWQLEIILIEKRHVIEACLLKPLRRTFRPLNHEILHFSFFGGQFRPAWIRWPNWIRIHSGSGSDQKHGCKRNAELSQCSLLIFLFYGYDSRKDVLVNYVTQQTNGRLLFTKILTCLIFRITNNKRIILILYTDIYQ